MRVKKAKITQPFLPEVLQKQFLTSHVHTLVPRLFQPHRLFAYNGVSDQAPSGPGRFQNHDFTLIEKKDRQRFETVYMESVNLRKEEVFKVNFCMSRPLD